ncbi:hypothetical protein KDW36_23235 [Burkholderia dolosa]|uniref:hypothetical protein n=1 Tax=Burkholderia dolosa TaxID=152500 RepID=UPI001B9771B0|nr:hypothetical protein [Burkholderia dolosa]MBR8316095.1 hypothetical protein [Burkholderia dolosa]
MTNISLAQRFQEARASKIELGGRKIYSLYEIDVSSGDTVLSLDFISSKKSSIQGVKIKASNCNVEVNNQILTDFVMWVDHSPKHIPMSIAMKKGAKATLKVWNVWKCDDVSHAWIGNAGMLVKKMIVKSHSIAATGWVIRISKALCLRLRSAKWPNSHGIGPVKN